MFFFLFFFIVSISGTLGLHNQWGMQCENCIQAMPPSKNYNEVPFQRVCCHNIHNFFQLFLHFASSKWGWLTDQSTPPSTSLNPPWKTLMLRYDVNVSVLIPGKNKTSYNIFGVRDHNDRTALHIAAIRGSKRCVQYILQHHPKCINLFDKNQVSKSFFCYYCCIFCLC